jgi:hypothetical protein
MTTCHDATLVLAADQQRPGRRKVASLAAAPKQAARAGMAVRAAEGEEKEP